MQGDAEAGEQIEQQCQPEIEGMSGRGCLSFSQHEALDSGADQDCEEIDDKAHIRGLPAFAPPRQQPAKKGREGRRENRPDKLAIDAFITRGAGLPEIKARPAGPDDSRAADDCKGT